MMFAKNYQYLIRLNKVTDNITNLTLDLYLDFTSLGSFMKVNILKTLIKNWNKKLDKLNLLSINQTI
ncbi:hypothetical protein [Flavobacterium ovatum]|uniref:hypothetical protein n=1 Tax=Flavobacterium ovatum TaxID=1928857 RepID=UPI00344BB634